MDQVSLKTVAEKLKDIDFCMMTTLDEAGDMQARPMSNNGQVEYDGDSWFFAYQDSHQAQQISKNPRVSLSFAGKKRLFIEVYGKGTVIQEKSVLEEHWIDELKIWFTEGVDTPGICLIRVTASRVHFWQDEEEGEYRPQMGR